MKALRTFAFCLALASALVVTACGDDEDDGGQAGTSGAGGAGGDAGGSGGTGGNDGGLTGGSGGTTGGAGGMTGGAGGMTGGSGDEDSGVEDEDGGADPKITGSAAIEGVDDNTLAGSVTFTADGPDVSVDIELNDCEDGSYQVHIHEGASCDNYGPHWDPPRGEGIPNVACDNGHGERTYVRLGTDAKPWSVDLGAEETDVNGHTFVVHDEDGTVLACGEISAD